MMQTLLVVLVISMAVGYAVWWVYNAFRHANDSCCGCEGCPLKDQMQCGK